MTLAITIRPTLRANLEADWQATLDSAPTEAIRTALLADSAIYAAFALGWRACARRFIHAGKEDAR